MTDLDLDWEKIYDDAMREGLKSRPELLYGVADSLDEVMKSNPEETAIVYLAMKERLKCRWVVLKGVARSLREGGKICSEMFRARGEAMKDMSKTEREVEEDRVSERACERDYEVELGMPGVEERFHALFDERRGSMWRGARVKREVVRGCELDERDYSLVWERELGGKLDGRRGKWSGNMESLEGEAIPVVSTSPIPSIPRVLPKSSVPQTSPVLSTSPKTSTPQILSTSSMPPTPSSGLGAGYLWESDSGSKNSELKQEIASPINGSERKELYPDDLYSDDWYSDGMKCSSPRSNHKSRVHSRSMATNYRELMMGSSKTKCEGAPIPKSLPMSNRIIQTNYNLCRLTNSPLPIRISDALHLFLLFYDVQSACAVSIENL